MDWKTLKPDNKKICTCLVISISLLLIPYAFADGVFYVNDEDIWSALDEEQQYCAINHKDGTQNMILAININENLKGEKAVWIFPVPAKPEETTINIIKGFPAIPGHYDVEKEADDVITETFIFIKASQIYPLSIWRYFINKMSAGALGDSGVIVHEKIEKQGLTTELISTTDSESFSNYLTNKDLELPEESKLILDEYIGQEYSFVVTWILDIEEFKKGHPMSYIKSLIEERKIDEAKSFLNNLSYDPNSEEGRLYSQVNEDLLSNTDRWGDEEIYYRYLKNSIQGARYQKYLRNSIGTYITFPTDTIYYPLKPTSVYGDKIVPAVIYVMGYVEPELYPQIKAYSTVNYLFGGTYTPKEDHRKFFFGQENVQDLKFTLIKIDSPSKYLTQDLWIKKSVPPKIKKAEYAIRYSFWYGLLFFIICSCLASLIAGQIIYKNTAYSKSRFALFGLFNFLTIIGFSIAIYSLRAKEVNKGTKDYHLQKDPKILWFLLAFTSSFMILSYIFEFLLKALIQI